MVAVRLREGEHALRPPVVELEVGVVLVGGKRRLGFREGEESFPHIGLQRDFLNNPEVDVHRTYGRP